MHNSSPGDTIAALWGKIPAVVKIAFFSALFFGLITHMFIFTNRLPNHDEIAQLVGNFDHTRWGRWFIRFPMRLGGLFSLPWASGMLSLAYLSAAVCLVVSTLKINRGVNAFLTAGLMITLPTVAGTLTYTQLSDSYFLALLLAAFAAFLANRFRFGYIYAVVPLVFSLGIYQAYFGLTAGLLVIILITDILRNNEPGKATVIKGLQFLGTLAVGMLLYLLIVRITMPPEGPTLYQGLDQIGQISLQELPRAVFNAYGRLAGFFLLDLRNVHYSFIPVVFILSVLVCIFLLALWCYRYKITKDPVKLGLLAALLLVFPLACNVIFLMGAAVVHDLMLYATVLVLIFFVVIIDMFSAKKQPTPGRVARAPVWALSLFVLVFIFNYWIASNQVYIKLYYGYQQTFAQSAVLIARIQNTQGFTENTQIVLVGTPRPEEGIPELHYITVTGSMGARLFGAWSYPLFLQRFLNVSQEIHFLRDAVIQDAYTAAALADMPLYPDYGSVRMINGRIYVNFARPGTFFLPDYRAD